jgi:hypothetical protein
MLQNMMGTEFGLRLPQAHNPHLSVKERSVDSCHCLLTRPSAATEKRTRLPVLHRLASLLSSGHDLQASKALF